MDLLSRFLSLTPVSGRIDERCHFGSPWAIEVGTVGVHEIQYHVLLAGEATLEDGNGPPQKLRSGDVILFPTRSPHRLHDGSGAAPVPAVKRRNITLTVAENGASGIGGSGASADVLCGRLLLGAVPDRLLRDHLPARLVVSTEPAQQQEAAAAALADSGAPGSAAGSRLARIVGLMREEAIDESPGSECLINYLSAALFALTLRFASERSAPPQGLLALSRQPRLQAALSAMFDAPGEPWTLDQFAALCNMSRATFVRQFQDAIGRSATDVLTEVRMTLAGRALLQTTDSVGEIGASVGYQSEAAFQRVFKRQIGVTPARWRATGGNLQAP
ncbi:AraC family transcriptional regulator [Paraburkholderia jirisanensis]